MEGITGTVNSIQIDNGKKSKRLLRVIHDLGPNFALNNDIRGGIGWSNGSLTMEAPDIDALYKDNLYLKVLTTGNPESNSNNGGASQGDALRCRIMSHLLNPAHELSSSPILMKKPSTQVSSSSAVSPVTGIAWTNVDSTCRVNYDVRLAGLKNQEADSQLVLKDYPIRYAHY